MTTFWSILRLIRLPNLFFIALTQYLCQYTIIKPILAQAGVTATLNDVHFFLLVLATVSIAAAGYIINDYFDIEIDEVNKPDKIVIGRTIHQRSAILLHQILTGIGVILALFVAWKAGNFKLGFIHAIIAAFLWFYSTGYKKRLLIGNIGVAFLSAFVIVLVALYERNLFESQSLAAVQAEYSIFVLLAYYFSFAFLLSLARELVKDAEDIPGDRRFGCKTLPIVYGIRKTRWVIAFLLGCVFLLLVYIQWIQANGTDFISVYMIFTTLQFPLLIAFHRLSRSIRPGDFTAVSFLIKIIMFLGILSMLYFYLLSH